MFSDIIGVSVGVGIHNQESPTHRVLRFPKPLDYSDLLLEKVNEDKIAVYIVTEFENFELALMIVINYGTRHSVFHATDLGRGGGRNLYTTGFFKDI